MSKHTIQLSGEDGKSFKVVVSIGYSGNSIGNGRSQENGFIRYSQGRAEYENAGVDTVRHLYFYESSQSNT